MVTISLHNVLNTDVVFIPAVWNEKNIQTNHQAGAKFDLPYLDGKAFYLIKSLGNGLVSIFLQNSVIYNE